MYVMIVQGRAMIPAGMRDNATNNAFGGQVRKYTTTFAMMSADTLRVIGSRWLFRGAI